MRGDWSDERVAMLRKLHHSDKLSFAAIGSRINRATGSAFTRNAIIGKAGRIGLVVKQRRSDVSKPSAKLPQKRRARQSHFDFRARDPFGGLEPDVNTLQSIERAPAPAEFLGIALLDLKQRHCRYPRGGDGTPILFCGQPRMEGGSYCAACDARCRLNGRRSAATKQMWRSRGRAT